MPKVKTKRSAAKRFSLTGSGKLRHSKTGRRHKLSKKTRKRKRLLGKMASVHSSNEKQVKRMLAMG